jgi:hypothetical protein
MGKRTVQIRITEDLATDVGIVAASQNKSVPKYVEEALSAAVAKDMPNAVKVTKERAEARKKKQQQAGEGEGE